MSAGLERANGRGRMIREYHPLGVDDTFRAKSIKRQSQMIREYHPLGEDDTFRGNRIKRRNQMIREYHSLGEDDTFGARSIKRRAKMKLEYQVGARILSESGFSGLWDFQDSPKRASAVPRALVHIRLGAIFSCGEKRESREPKS